MITFFAHVYFFWFWWSGLDAVIYVYKGVST